MKKIAIFEPYFSQKYQKETISLDNIIDNNLYN